MVDGCGPRLIDKPRADALAETFSNSLIAVACSLEHEADGLSVRHGGVVIGETEKRLRQVRTLGVIMNFARRWTLLLLLLAPLVYFAVSWLRRDGPRPPVVFSLFVLFATAMAVGRSARRVHQEGLLSGDPVPTGLSWPKALRAGIIIGAGSFALQFAAADWGFVEIYPRGRLVAGLALGSCLSALFAAALLRVIRRPPKLDT